MSTGYEEHVLAPLVIPYFRRYDTISRIPCWQRGIQPNKYPTLRGEDETCNPNAGHLHDDKHLHTLVLPPCDWMLRGQHHFLTADLRLRVGPKYRHKYQ